ncbi:DedA family protein [Aurantimonas sp. C2-6-R+9]|uniref:DedA family protein n=2 Tax=root TaxID=1 RepID=A0A9C9THU1_9HYPH|nr:MULTISPECIES: DedA family protein [unclassified Aurantimonas]MEC5289925.1 DedA family protein [Aurantimonas sp. C2-3-R2]MEC5322392.1 DedA family protein [Aurantimonas sp. A3-2-R12]MEC5379935.1 DedA family protein [Aurantimonas sp. C2-6-R+9]MEC5411007.1 DedA family protein [Aurantimonas sp. C2-4-R8]HDZ75358.1 DedA family protein [Aurantimonas coralicida]
MYEILSLIGQFGPIIVLAGTFFEGEVFAIIGGFLAYRGSYPFEMMIALAFAGSFVGDLSVFLFARFSSNHRWVARWRSRRKFAKALELVERYQAYFVIVNRYIYGLRMPGLIALGLSRISITRFVLLNLFGAALWAGIFTTVGYVFGYSIGSVFAHLQVMERGVGIVLIVIAVALAGWFAWRQWGPVFMRRARNRRGERLAPGSKRRPTDPDLR